MHLMVWTVIHDRNKCRGSCGHGNEQSGFIKGKEFLNQQNENQLFKKGDDINFSGVEKLQQGA